MAGTTAGTTTAGTATANTGMTTATPPETGFVCQPGAGAKTAVAIFAGKAAQKRKQGDCKTAFFVPAFDHRLSLNPVASNHHSLSKFSFERNPFGILLTV
jgi:hypothetical protein